MHDRCPTSSTTPFVTPISRMVRRIRIAMAVSAPHITALGVDLAAAPIADGQQAIAEMGLTNVELRRGDVRSLPDLGQFDYVIAHGLYSWVPEDARDALMQQVNRLLAPDGIAYVSYNAEPGGYFRRMLRDAGLWHARDAVGELA